MENQQVPMSVADQAKLTIQQVLSGIREKRLSLVDSLTSTPFHPYEKLKFMYLDQKGLSGMRIEDLPPVSAFDLVNVTNQLTAINQSFMDDIFSRYPLLTSTEVFNNPETGNIFATLSTNSYVVNEERLAKHLQHIEMVKHITVEQINQNPLEVAHKILDHFVKTYDWYRS